MAICGCTTPHGSLLTKVRLTACVTPSTCSSRPSSPTHASSAACVTPSTCSSRPSSCMWSSRPSSPTHASSAAACLLQMPATFHACFVGRRAAACHVEQDKARILTTNVVWRSARSPAAHMRAHYTSRCSPAAKMLPEQAPGPASGCEGGRHGANIRGGLAKREGRSEFEAGLPTTEPSLVGDVWGPPCAPCQAKTNPCRQAG